MGVLHGLVSNVCFMGLSIDSRLILVAQIALVDSSVICLSVGLSCDWHVLMHVDVDV